MRHVTHTNSIKGSANVSRDDLLAIKEAYICEWGLTHIFMRHYKVYIWMRYYTHTCMRRYTHMYEACCLVWHQTLQRNAKHCSPLQHTAAHCNTLQHIATHCNTLQHTATHCSTAAYACANAPKHSGAQLNPTGFRSLHVTNFSRWVYRVSW